MPTQEDGFRDTVKQLARSMEAVAVIGGALGLAVAAFSGPLTVGAVFAELSIDLSVGFAGVVLDKFGDRITPALRRLRNFINDEIENDLKGKKADLSSSVSKVALVTAPLELMTGFAITGFSRPIAYAAVIVTALPCTAIAAAGIVYGKIKKHRERKEETALRIHENELIEPRTPVPIVVPEAQRSELNLKGLERNKEPAKRRMVF